jgi:hypothetical protein
MIKRYFVIFMLLSVVSVLICEAGGGVAILLVKLIKLQFMWGEGYTMLSWSH